MLPKYRKDHHVFKTNHRYFIDLGLGTFTLNQLIEWWNQKDSNENYLNHRHVDGGLGELLGVRANTNFKWYGWKPNLDTENDGKYVEQSLLGIGGNAGGGPAWEYKGKVIANASHINAFIGQLGIGANGPITSVNLTANGNDLTVAPAYAPNAPYYAPLLALEPIYHIIQLNRFMNLFEDFHPFETWDWSLTTVGGWNNLYLGAAWALLNEIRTAKGSPCLEWTAPVTVNVNQYPGILPNNSKITEDIKFCLYLMDEGMSPDSNKFVTMKKMVYVSPKKDALGASPTTDGERAAGATGDNDQVAGELDMQWNPVTKKFQSGNVNMLGKMVTNLDIGRVPSIDHLLTNDIKESLEGSDEAVRYIPSSGLAMPIRAQNGMPMQWSPNYQDPEDKRCVDNNKKKQIINVFNFNTKKSYVSGEEVLLTLIDNVWHVSDLGYGELAGPETTTPKVGRWGEFTYMMTSSEFFFKGITGNNSRVDINPTYAEHNFHYKFYKDCQGRSHVDGQAIGNLDYLLNFVNGDYSGLDENGLPSGGYDVASPFNTTGHVEFFDRQGYLQTTSFDYLDQGLGGLNDSCRIASTSATINSAGKAIPFEAGEFLYNNAAHTGPFFGCVFTNGYAGTTVYDGDHDWTIVAVNRGRDEDQFLKTPTLSNPFEITDVFASRNACNTKCVATTESWVFNQTPDINITSDRNSWTRGTDNVEASIFYLNASAGRKSFPADVMLNASHEGKNGAPIRPISRLLFLNNATEPAQGTASSRLVNDGAWLCKGGENYDITDSAFDFTPISNSLMFRPLKLEAYIQYGRPPGFKFGTVLQEAANLDRTDAKYLPYVFYSETARTQVDYIPPLAPCWATIMLREDFNSSSNRFDDGVGGVDKPLKWGGLLQAGLKESYGDRLHPHNYWNTSPAPGAYPDHGGALGWTKYPGMSKFEVSEWEKGASAYGVIGSRVKVTANTSIELGTSNRYGQGPNIWGEFKQGGYPNNYKTWGVGNFIESYKQANIIDLSARIYQGWDTNSTVYDPRYFAVHHFNPGVDYIWGLYKGQPTDQTPINDLGVYIRNNHYPIANRNFLDVQFRSFYDAGGRALDIRYVYPEQSGVDIPWPTRYRYFAEPKYGTPHPGSGYYVGVTVTSEDASILRNAVFEGSLQPPLMDEQYWWGDQRRTGKLLPYRYQKPVVGIPFREGANLTVGNGIVLHSGIQNESILNHLNKLVIKNPGKGFKQAVSVVGIASKNVIMLVSSTDSNGGITGLSVLAAGSGIQAGLCAGSGDVITDNYSTGLRLQALAGDGEDFEAYFVNASINYTIACDSKPFLIRSAGDAIKRIAAPVSGPSHQTGQIQPETAYAGAFVEENHTESWLIPPELKSGDATYDIFLHFHNDITMTWMASAGDGNGENGSYLFHGYTWGRTFFNPSTQIEQHITLESISVG